MTRTALLGLLVLVVACSTTMTPNTKGAVCVADREIVLLENPNPMTTTVAADMMGRTIGTIRVGEVYEVLDTFQRTDPNTKAKTGPRYLKIRSRNRAEVVGWAFATTIRSHLVN